MRIFNYYGAGSKTIGHDIILRAVEQEIRALANVSENLLLEPEKFNRATSKSRSFDRTSFEKLKFQLRIQQAYSALTLELFKDWDFCMPWPPCDWEKDGDKIKLNKIKDIVSTASTESTYIYKIIDSSGELVVSYKPKLLDKELPTLYQQYHYFEKDLDRSASYVGEKLKFIVERFTNGSETPDRVFEYEFELIQ